MPGSRAVLMVSLSLITFCAAGCGGHKSSSASSHAVPVAVTTTARPAVSTSAATTYRAGAFCSGRHESNYIAHRLVCVTGRLRRTARSHYRPGQFCSGREQPTYLAAGLTCIRGRLKKQ